MVLKTTSLDFSQDRDRWGPTATFPVSSSLEPILLDQDFSSAGIPAERVVPANVVPAVTLLGEGSKQLPIPLFHSPSLLDGFGSKTTSYVFSVESVLKKRAPKPGNDKLSVAEDIVALVQGAHCATELGGLDFASGSEFLLEKGRRVVPADLGKIFRKVVCLKQLPAILALFTEISLDDLLQGYALSVPNVAMVFFAAKFANISISRFGGKDSLTLV